MITPIPFVHEYGLSGSDSELYNPPEDIVCLELRKGNAKHIYIFKLTIE